MKFRDRLAIRSARVFEYPYSGKKGNYHASDSCGHAYLCDCLRGVYIAKKMRWPKNDTL